MGWHGQNRYPVQHPLTGGLVLPCLSLNSRMPSVSTGVQFRTDRLGSTPASAWTSDLVARCTWRSGDPRPACTHRRAGCSGSCDRFDPAGDRAASSRSIFPAATASADGSTRNEIKPEIGVCEPVRSRLLQVATGARALGSSLTDRGPPVCRTVWPHWTARRDRQPHAAARRREGVSDFLSVFEPVAIVHNSYPSRTLTEHVVAGFPTATPRRTELRRFLKPAGSDAVAWAVILPLNCCQSTSNASLSRLGCSFRITAIVVRRAGRSVLTKVSSLFHEEGRHSHVKK